MKIKIGEVFKKYLSKTNFKYDISMDINDTKHGQDWIKFLCDSEFTWNWWIRVYMIQNIIALKSV